MKKKGFYLKEEDIPAEDKHLYHKANGRWEFNVSLFEMDGDESLDALVAPALKANNQKLNGEKDAAQEEARVARIAQKAAEDNLAKAQKPGTKIITDAEDAQFQEYKKLGPVADIQRDLKLKGELEGEVAKTKAEKELDTTVEELKMNPEATKDFLFNTTYGQGAKLVSKDGKVKVTDPKTKKESEVDGKIAHVEYETKEGDKVTKHTKSLTDFVKEKNVPQYLVDALFAPVKKADASKDDTSNNGRKKAYVPADSTRKTNTDKSEGGQEKAPVDRFNQERSTRQLPWTAKPEGQQT